MWKITYYNKKVFGEIMALPKTLRAGFVFLTGRMKESGPNLGMPYTRAMGKGLFEIRIKGQEGIARVFYCTQINHELVMLHSFVKKTQKTPQKELEIAKKRMTEVIKNG
ncbi:MAG TPA: type II toxin-antitoxin system RelE/ParE family toxin [Gammaproteobacteria bacterium]|jgi:phage-related protein|nr:type II toxin-antitoxin system RelE/ParE family toxin [Gammaproteobacteria bacterium]